jgi:hypothetical protein
MEAEAANMSLARSLCCAALSLALTGEGASAAALNCRVLYRITCAPDLCSPMDKVVDHIPQIPSIRIIISANWKRLSYIERGKMRTAAISVKRLTNGIRLVTGRIHWPSYDGDRDGHPLGRVRMIFDGMAYYWRVGYLGTSEAQEYEDVLIGDCPGQRW